MAAIGCLSLLLMLMAGCQPSNSSGARVATATSYLEACVRDLLGGDVAVLRLAEPGTCPGHFDIRPSQVQQLRQCQAVVRFDFQRSLDTKFAGAGMNAPRVAEIKIEGGMCVPGNYLAACTQTAEHLVETGLLSREEADARLDAIRARLDTLAMDATDRVAAAGLAGVPVITSVHQRDFCEWLGLDVVATFRAADTASISEIEKAIAAGRLARVKLVIANLPEGRRTADALAGRLDAGVVVFENFPALEHGRVSFHQMISANLEALLGAAAP